MPLAPLPASAGVVMYILCLNQTRLPLPHLPATALPPQRLLPPSPQLINPHVHQHPPAPPDPPTPDARVPHPSQREGWGIVYPRGSHNCATVRPVAPKEVSKYVVVITASA